MILFPRYPLAEGLTISRVINGLWQIADLEREGRAFDLDQALSLIHISEPTRPY